MRLAIPLVQGKLCQHFGHCEMFAVIDANTMTGAIEKRQDLQPPAHEPGVLPAWLAEQGVNLVVAGGMGGRARAIFVQAGIEVVVGAPVDTPERLATAYLTGSLQTGENACDH